MVTIQELIKSPLFNNEHVKAVIGLTFIGNIIDYNSNQVTGRFNLSAQQYNALRILGVEYPKSANINFIKGRMTYKMSDVSRIISRLSTAGLVKSVKSTVDRRAADVIITQEGLDLLAKITQAEDEIFKPTKNLTLEEARMLNQLLDKIADTMYQDE